MRKRSIVNLRTPLALVLLVHILACATITRGTKEVLVVESEPVGAKVSTSSGLTGTTPATFKVSRKGGFVVTIEKEGFETVQVQVDSQIAGAGAAGMAGNVFLGGLVGAAVDAGSGAMRELKPNPISVKLEPLANAVSDEPVVDAKTKPSEQDVTVEGETNGELEAESIDTSYLIEIVPLDDKYMQLRIFNGNHANS